MSRSRYQNPNRIYGGGALATHAVWQDTIGYDPHAPLHTDHPTPALAPPGAPNSLTSGYDQFRALLARATASKGVGQALGSGTRATCPKCGGSGHLALNCWNLVLPSQPRCVQGRGTGGAARPGQSELKPAAPTAESSGDAEKKRKREVHDENEKDAKKADKSKSKNKKRRREKEKKSKRKDKHERDTRDRRKKDARSAH